MTQAALEQLFELIPALEQQEWWEFIRPLTVVNC